MVMSLVFLICDGGHSKKRRNNNNNNNENTDNDYNTCKLYATLNLNDETCLDTSTDQYFEVSLPIGVCLDGWIEGCKYMIKCNCNINALHMIEYWETGGCHGDIASTELVIGDNQCRPIPYACTSNPNIGRRMLTNDEFIKCCPECTE